MNNMAIDDDVDSKQNRSIFSSNEKSAIFEFSFEFSFLKKKYLFPFNRIHKETTFIDNQRHNNGQKSMTRSIRYANDNTGGDNPNQSNNRWRKYQLSLRTSYQFIKR